MLLVESVSKTYAPASRLLRPLIRTASDHPVEALRDVSFEVASGTIVGFVGPNGAGKTTLIKIIATLLEATSGRVLLGGIDVARQPLHARSHTGLVLADERGLYWRLTGRQNLEMFGVLNGLSRQAARRRSGELLEELDLDAVDKRVFGYSTGMRLRLNIARALLAEPSLLVLDEPSRSLDPVASSHVAQLLRRLAVGGTAVLLSSHRLDEVAATCDHVVAIRAGCVHFDGTSAELGGEHSARLASLATLLGVDDT